MKKLLLIFLLLLSGKTSAEPAPPSAPHLRLALSSVFLGERQDLISRWKTYLEMHLQRPVVFVQRRTYRELTDLFAQGKLDAGWVCAAPYTLHKSVQRLLAVPVWQREPLYQSYLIVSAHDTVTHSIADLRGKIFAYSDPESNSGFFVAQGELVDLGVDPATFFSKTLFTYAHRNNVEAVAAKLVDGARVDGYIYDMLRLQAPELVAKTRIVQKSDKYGFPPIVARANLPEEDYRKLQETLINMKNDTEGQALLAAMGLNGFVAGDDHLFDSVAALLKKVSVAGQQRVR
jgi:phosphonate transport system substrate-binding protein